MSCLLDTPALLWALFDPARLGKKAVDCIQNPDVTVSVSVASFWEISLKYATGKLELSGVRQSGFGNSSTNRAESDEVLDELTFCRMRRNKNTTF